MKIRHLCFITDFPTRLFDAMDQARDHDAETVRPNMGLLFIQDFFRSTGGNKGFKDMSHNGVIDPRREFSIGKGARPASAKLDIADRIKLSRLPKCFHIFYAVGKIPSPLHYKGMVAVFRKFEGSHQPGRAKSHHEGTPVQLFASNLGLWGLCPL